jgi:DNA-directed RNA polymerase subunit L
VEDGGGMLDVTTSDIRGSFDGVELSREELDKIFLCEWSGCGPILITRLRSGEEISVELVLILGVGVEHGSFSSVSKCVYFNEVDEERVRLGVLGGELLLGRVLEMHEKYRYFKRCVVTGEANSFRFSIEPLGQCRGIELVLRAIEILREETEVLEGSLWLGERVLVSCSEKIEGNRGVNITCPGLDHGLANLINEFIYNREFLRMGVESVSGGESEELGRDGKLSYFGFHKPHPLEDTIVFRLVLKDQYPKVETERDALGLARQIFGDHLRVLVGELRGTTFPLRPPPGA